MDITVMVVQRGDPETHELYEETDVYVYSNHELAEKELKRWFFEVELDYYNRAEKVTRYSGVMDDPDGSEEYLVIALFDKKIEETI